jgi:homoserine O-acetyltransferase
MTFSMRSAGPGTAAVALVLANALVASAQNAAARSDESSASRRVLLDPSHAEWMRPSPDSFRARIETNRGTFVIAVRREWSPNGADRFYNLVRHGYYDDSRVSRVVAGFIAQFGIAGDPAVNAAWRGRTINDDPVRTSNARGTIAFAMTGPHTRLTQLFISVADNSRLDVQGFAPLGRVIEGMDVVDAIHSDYGESAGGGMRAGGQGLLLAGGNAYIDRMFPNLDRIVRASIVN